MNSAMWTKKRTLTITIGECFPFMRYIHRLTLEYTLKGIWQLTARVTWLLWYLLALVFFCGNVYQFIKTENLANGIVCIMLMLAMREKRFA